MVETEPSSARGEGLIPGQGDKVPYTRKPKLETSNIGTNSMKSLKMIHIKNLYKKKKNHRHTLLHIKEIINENLLKSTGNSTQFSVVTETGRKSKNEGMLVHI